MSSDSPAASPAPAPAGWNAEDPARTRWAVGAVLIATALAFATSLGGGFVWDDVHLIAYNRNLAGLAGLRHALTHHLWDVETVLSDSSGVRYYRPAVGALFVALRTLFGTSPAPYHAVVVLLHLGAVALLARLLARVLGARPLPVAAGAALFALHASRSQSVTWISGVSDVLMALPVLAAMTHALPRPAARAPGPRAAVVSAALTVLALAAKETALVLPAALFALVLAAWPAGPARHRALAAYVAAPLAVCALYLAARARWLPIGASGGVPPPGRHALLVLESLGRYAGIVAWPWPIASFRTALNLDESGQVRVAWGWSLVGALVALAGLYALARARKYRLEVAGLAVAVIFLAPVLNVRWTGYVELVGDRFLYVPVAGLAISLGALLTRVEARAQRAVVLAVAGLALAHGASVALEALDYRDELSFWSAENELCPGVPRVLIGLAGADRAAGRAGRAFLEARAAYAAMGRYREGPRSGPAAVMAFGLYVGLELMPDRDRQGLLGALAFLRGLDDPAAERGEGFLLGDPIGLPKQGLGGWLRTEGAMLRDMEANVLARLGRVDESVATAREAAAVCVSRCDDAQRALALAYARSGRWDEAERALRAARALSPDPAATEPVEAQVAAARAKAREAAGARGPEERALREAELWLILDLPEAARAVLEPFGSSPATAAARVRVALMAYQFEQAHAVARTMPPPGSPEEVRARRSLAALEAVQRQKIAGVEARVGAR